MSLFPAFVHLKSLTFCGTLHSLHFHEQFPRHLVPNMKITLQRNVAPISYSALSSYTRVCECSKYILFHIKYIDLGQTRDSADNKRLNFLSENRRISLNIYAYARTTMVPHLPTIFSLSAAHYHVREREKLGNVFAPEY